MTPAPRIVWVVDVDHASTASTDVALLIKGDELVELDLLLLREELRDALPPLPSLPLAAYISTPGPPRPPGRNPYVAPRARPPKSLGVKRR